MRKFLLRAALAASVGMILGVTTNAYAADKGGSEYYDPTTIAAEAPSKKALWTGAYIEGGFGMTASNVEIAGMVTLGDTAWAGHVGIGYDHMISPHIVVGILGRAEINEIKHEIGGLTLADTQVEYLVGGRVGWVPRSDWMLYVLAGYRFSELDLNNNIGGDVSSNAWVVGGGIEAMVTDHVFIGLEYTAALGESENVGGVVSVETTDHAGKARLGFKF